MIYLEEAQQLLAEDDTDGALIRYQACQIYAESLVDKEPENPQKLRDLDQVYAGMLGMAETAADLDGILRNLRKRLDVLLRLRSLDAMNEHSKAALAGVLHDLNQNVEVMSNAADNAKEEENWRTVYNLLSTAIVLSELVLEADPSDNAARLNIINASATVGALLSNSNDSADAAETTWRRAIELIGELDLKEEDSGLNELSRHLSEQIDSLDEPVLPP